MSSRYEGFGLVLTEAMACGLPCVAFDCHSGPSDIITDGVDGYLVAQNNIEGLANAMMDLMSNPAKRYQMGMNAQKKSKVYDIHQIINKWMSLFSRLMANS
jgi:glycosyltransferase involved in cell wall biosynthesis